MKYLLLTIILLFANSVDSPLRATGGDEEKKSETKVEKSTKTDKSPEKKAVEIPALTVENLKQVIEDAGIKESDVVLRQAILETGWFKCQHCSMGSNNLFGFFYKGKYLEFENWMESVEYYKWWQDQLYKGGDYYTFLKKVGYAEAPNYIQKLKSLEGDY